MGQAVGAAFAVLLTLLPSPSSVDAAETPTITLAGGTAEEERTRRVLEEILRRPGISRWIFTDRVVIDETTRIPHSHPVLTLNGRYTEPNMLLSVFVHENIHWFLSEKSEEVNAAVAELQALYPDVPVGGSRGARSTFSTYLHLINCWLEIEAVADMAGRATADAILDQLSRHHYTWIYERVRDDNETIGAVVRRHGLMPLTSN